MSKLECFSCLNCQFTGIRQIINASEMLQNQDNAKYVSSKQSSDKQSVQMIFKQQKTLKNTHTQVQSNIFFLCDICNKTYCKNCCITHINNKSCLKKQQKKDTNQNQTFQKLNLQLLQNNEFFDVSSIKIICQECQEDNSIKYCQNCEQYLCENCSFKIHNKGKRTKHKLNQNSANILKIRSVTIFFSNLIPFLNNNYLTKQNKSFEQLLMTFLLEQLKISSIKTNLILYEQILQQQMTQIKNQKLIYKMYNIQNLNYDYLVSLTNQYPFINNVKIILTFRQQFGFKKIISDKQEYQNQTFNLEILQEYKKLEKKINNQKQDSQHQIKHHNKNISNFSNVSAISKIQNQSILSNQNSQYMSINQLSLNITLNQNCSFLMMGALSERDKIDEKQEIKQYEIKFNERSAHQTHHRIYSIRQEAFHQSVNNLSTSTENSTRKRNKKGPIPYFQSFRVSKNDCTSRYDAELYLRYLADKGILMLRKQKADKYLFDSEISRKFTRNIGETQIQYISYIIDFISVQCLSWVIESIKQDKMTPNQKLILSRIKESFDLKINIKLWESVIKYFQSSQYEQDYLDNTKNRYIPKITVLKYAQQFLLQFEERKWQYQDQQLLDEDEEEWKQFKNLLNDYFDGHTQITGGRYGCVQYVKLNGPKPLRNCSLGKLSMYVQQAINKGLIRYHKTLLVSNSQNNTSTSNVKSGTSSIPVENPLNLTQLQKQIKISTIQVVLIDMFMQIGPNTPISLAQIPLNLKKNIIFDINLVQLGFPKLKNMLNTLSDKLLLETTKTHVTYEVTSNGCETIQKQRSKLLQMNKKFLQYILNTIIMLINNYQTISLQDLYNQINYKYNFILDYKIFNMPDFYQFTIYYCSHILNVQFFEGIFIAFNKYNSYTMQNYEKAAQNQQIINQNYAENYSNIFLFNDQNQYQNYDNSKNDTNNFNSSYSKSYDKKVNFRKQSLEINAADSQPVNYYATSIKTPKFNDSIQYNRKKMNTFNWQYYDDVMKKQDKNQYDFDQSFNDQQSNKSILQIVNNILDDENVSESKSKVSYPKTVIQKECLSATNPLNNELYILTKVISTDQKQSFDDQNNFQYFDSPQNQEIQKNCENVKWQHIRVKSTNEARVKHERMYSTKIPRK